MYLIFTGIFAYSLVILDNTLFNSASTKYELLSSDLVCLS